MIPASRLLPPLAQIHLLLREVGR